MKMKKGFTLIELLTVIIILSLLTLITVNVVMNMVKKGKETINSKQETLFLKAAELWFSDNTELLPENGLCVYVTLGKLKEEGVLDDELYNIIEMEKLDDATPIKVTNNVASGGKLNYKYEYNPTDLTGCVNVSSDPNYAGSFIAASASDTHKGTVYFDPIDLTHSCNSTDALTNTSPNTGCMRFYIFDSTFGEYVLIADRNISSGVAWNSTGNNEVGMNEVQSKLTELTTGWYGNPRLISATEIAKLIGTDTKLQWNKNRVVGTNVATQSSWYYLDGNGSTYSGWQTQIANSTNPSKYTWLYDNTTGCKAYGCEKESNVTGYWTSDAALGTNAAWVINNQGKLTYENVDNTSYGIRPVITIPKSIIDNATQVVAVPTVASVCKANIVYNGSSQNLVKNLDNIVLTNTFGTSAGSYTITATIAEGANLIWEDFTSGTKTITCDIKPKPLVPSANCSNKVYDGNDNAECTINLATLVSGDTVDVAKTCKFNNSSAANNKTVTCSGISISGDKALNYLLSTNTVTTTANITQRTIPAVTNLQVTTNGIVTWTGVDNATGYQISIDGTNYTSASSGINYLSTITAATGARTVSVKAVNNDTVNYVNQAPTQKTVNVYTLTINRNNNNYGTVSSSSYKVISGATYSTSSNQLTVTGNNATLTTVTATPSTVSGYTSSFSSWSPASGTITSNTTVTANFAVTDNVKPTYSQITVSNISPTGYNVTVTGVSDNGGSGIDRVQFPTWTDLNGQDDIQSNWSTNTAAKGTDGGNGTWTYRVNTTAHNNEAGKYYTHVYIYDKNGNVTATTVGADNGAVNVPTVTATFNANGGSTASPSTIVKAYNNKLGTLPTTSRTGYTFAGWFTAASGGTQITADTLMPSSNTTYYAHWTANNYYLDLNGWLDGASSGNISNYGTCDVYVNGTKVAEDAVDYYTQHPYGSSYTINDCRAANGRTYNGAYSGGSPLSGTIGAGTVGVYVSFTSNTYYVTYDLNGGSNGPSPNPQSFVYNSGAKLSTTVPTKNGYDFAHWKYSNGSNTFAAGAAIPTGWGSFTAVAQWTIHTNTLTVNPNGGSWGGSTSATSVTQNYGTTIAVPNASGKANTSRQISSYTVTYNANSGSVSPTSATATKTGTYSYAFSSWSNSGTCGSMSGTTYTFPANKGTTCTKTANWSESLASTSGGSVTLPTPTRSGYTFNGWYTASSGGTRVGGAGESYTPTGNITLFAQWSAAAIALSHTTNAVTGGGYNLVGTSVTFSCSGSTGNLPKTMVVGGTTYTNSNNANPYSVSYQYTEPGANQTVSATCTGQLNNTASDSVTFTIYRQFHIVVNKNGANAIGWSDKYWYDTSNKITITMPSLTRNSITGEKGGYAGFARSSSATTAPYLPSNNYTFCYGSGDYDSNCQLKGQNGNVAGRTIYAITNSKIMNPTKQSGGASGTGITSDSGYIYVWNGEISNSKSITLTNRCRSRSDGKTTFAYHADGGAYNGGTICSSSQSSCSKTVTDQIFHSQLSFGCMSGTDASTFVSF